MEHGLHTDVIAVFAAAVVVWSLVSARLDRLSITPALAFVIVGLVVANPPLSLVEIDTESETVRSLAEVTLALVLFTDAARVDLQGLRADAQVPFRLLLIGLPLTVAAGLGLALVLFADLDLWVCAVVAAAVAPTDAALGAPLMADRRIPARVRRELNVESGLNDGLITPVVTFCIAGAVAHGGTPTELSAGSALVDLALGLVVGVGLGLAGGAALRLARHRSWASSAVETVAVLALALLAYAAAVETGGNGFVAAFAGGMAFGAVRRAAVDVLGFVSESGELLAIVVWFVFGAIAVPALDGAPWSVAAFAVLALDHRAHGPGRPRPNRYRAEPAHGRVPRLVRPPGTRLCRVRPHRLRRARRRREPRHDAGRHRRHRPAQRRGPRPDSQAPRRPLRGLRRGRGSARGTPTDTRTRVTTPARTPPRPRAPGNSADTSSP